MSDDIKDRRIATHFDTSARWTDGKPHCLGIFYEPDDIDELVTTDSGVYGPAKEEAERLVACWNAFLGVPTEKVASVRAAALEEVALHVATLPRWCTCDDGGQGGCVHDAAVEHVVAAIRALGAKEDGT